MNIRQIQQLLGEETPAQVKHCVRKVAAKHGGDTSRAFAICVAAGQKHGTLKAGTMQSTAKGKKADAAKKKEPGHDDAVSDYEKLLKKNRKSEDIYTEAAMKKIKWEKKDEKISVAFVEIPSETSYGKPRTIKVALRVDGRGDTWRVDMADAVAGTWMPFEAVDGGKGFSTEAQAKAHAAKWYAAAHHQMTAHPKVEDTMPVRTDMMKLLGEIDSTDWQARRDQGATSTGKENKPAKKTPKDDKPPPNVKTSGADDKASPPNDPGNKPGSKKPMKAGVSPPNVTGAVEDAKRITRIYAGIDSKYGPTTVEKKVERTPYLSTIKTESSEDPILKLALEGLRADKPSHPFE